MTTVSKSTTQNTGPIHGFCETRVGNATRVSLGRSVAATASLSDGVSVPFTTPSV